MGGIAVHQTFFKRAQSTAGAILVGVGAFIFCANLDRAAIELIQFFGSIPRQALGIMPTVILAAARVVQAYADHRHFLHCSVFHTLASLWPLLLVVARAVLSRDSFAD
jgi:hypothetical protein